MRIGTFGVVTLGLVLVLGSLLVVASAGAAQTTSDTVRVDPGDHAALEIDFREGPSSDVSYEVQVTEGPNIDVLLMNNADYQAYQQGDSFEYIGAWSDLDTGNTQAEFLLEEHGTWWLVIDHSSEPDDGANPATVGAESVTASYTLSVETNVEEELRDEIPLPHVSMWVLLASGVAMLARPRSLR